MALPTEYTEHTENQVIDLSKDEISSLKSEGLSSVCSRYSVGKSGF